MTSKKTIGVIDYGMGNLRSVGKAVERMGGSVYVGSDPKKLRQAEKLILPGVGAFGDAMRELKRRNLISVIGEAIEKRKPFLGVCLGLQLLFERSEESPGVKGLGVWKGVVKRFRLKKGDDLKIPQMGWNQVNWVKPSPIVKGVKTQSYFYFVHSYFADPKDRSLIVGNTDYSVKFPSVLANGTVFAVQFHPEKSQNKGLKILKNFIEL
ncbi:MAG TPA: imidazole glycerol phosphate synthase subunit HisH [Candidatus Omnitrophota bacterium]|nr:imidazole glycerol phosphate synthase subunit HisH [Candidatus Omnitrophota bacterium]